MPSYATEVRFSLEAVLYGGFSLFDNLKQDIFKVSAFVVVAQVSFGGKLGQEKIIGAAEQPTFKGVTGPSVSEVIIEWMIFYVTIEFISFVYGVGGLADKSGKVVYWIASCDFEESSGLRYAFGSQDRFFHHYHFVVALASAYIA